MKKYELDSLRRRIDEMREQRTILDIQITALEQSWRKAQREREERVRNSGGDDRE